MILIIVLQFVSIAAANMLIPSYGAVIEYYNVPTSLIGIPDAVFVLLSAVLAVVWGYYTDRIDRSRIVIIGAIMWSIGTTLTAFNTLQNINGYRILIAARAITGAGMGSVIPVASSVMGDIVPAENRSSWFGTMAILSSISNGAGQGLSSFLGHIEPMKWRLPFFIISLMSIGVIIMLFFIKIPERGSQEEELASLQDLEMEYLYQLSKKDIKKILTKKTNLAIFIQGFFSIIPGTLIIYFLTTMFSDSSQGLFQILPEGIRLQISSIMAALVGIGYIVGNSVLAGYGDYLYKKKPKYRTLLCVVSISIAIPCCTLFLFTAPRLDAQILPYQDENMFVIIYQIFRIYPQSIAYVLLSFIGSFFSAAPVSARNAVLMDVNLPEHRGTTTSLFALSEQIGKAITLGLSYVLLTWFATYQMMILFAITFWIPPVFLWWYASKHYIADMNEKSLRLKERTQLTFIDYFFELEIKIDQATQYIFDARRILHKDRHEAIELIDKAARIFEGIQSMAKRKEMNDLEQRTYTLGLKALLLQSDVKRLIQNENNPKFDMGAEVKIIREKIDEEWQPTDLRKVEILFESGDLKVIEARLQRKYDLFRSIQLLKEAVEIFERVELLLNERLIDEDSKKLTDDEKQFQDDIKDMIIRAVKAKLDTNELMEIIDELIEDLSDVGIDRQRLVQIIDKAKGLDLPYMSAIVDLVPSKRGRRKISRTIDEVDEAFDEYDKWSAS